MGRSLGGGAATDLADARPVRALILLSTFSSARRVAWRRFGALPFIVRDAFDNRAALSRFDGPVLVVHGTRDEILPFAEAERLAGVRTGIELVGLPCGHNDCPRDWDAFASTIRRFLTGHGIL